MCGTRLLGLPRGFSVLNFVNDCGLRDVLCVKADDEARAVNGYKTTCALVDLGRI